MKSGQWGKCVRALLSTAVAAAALGVCAAPPAQAIEGGRPASAGSYPWAVSLRPVLVPFGFCGGVVLSPTKVLTAAHCTDMFAHTPSLLHAVAGRDRVSGSGGTEVSVKRIWRDPGYSSFTYKGETGYRNDVAILTLKHPIGNATLPIANPQQTDIYRPGTTARILGWGTSKEGAKDGGLLRTATVPVVSDNLCSAANSYGSAYDPSQYTCAGNFEQGKVDTCEYDSGTPLVVNGTVAGITSWGVGCGRSHYPGLYTRISSFSDEIKQQLSTD